MVSSRDGRQAERTQQIEYTIPEGAVDWVEQEPDDPYYRLRTTFERNARGAVRLATESGTGIAPRTTEVIYDEAGWFPEQSINALHQVTTVRFDPKNGAIQTLKDPNSLITQYTRDGFGRPLSSVEPGGVTTSIAYSEPTPADRQLSQGFGQLSVRTARSGSGPRTTVTDSFGASVLEKVTGFEGQEIATETTYDAAGRIDTVTRPHVDATQGNVKYQYDARGRVSRITYADQTEDEYRYGLPDELDSTSWRPETDLAAVEVVRGFGTHSRPFLRISGATEVVAAVDAAGGLSQYRFGPFHELSEVIGPDDDTAIRYDRDRLGRIETIYDPNAGQRSFSYYPTGEVHVETSALGTTNYQFDVLGRPTMRERPDGTTSWEYDGDGSRDNEIGRLVQVLGPPTATNPNGHSTRYAYESARPGLENRGLLQDISRTIGSATLTQHTEYDDFGRAEHLFYPQAGDREFVVRNEYDAASGMLKSVRNGSNLAAAPYWQLQEAYQGYLLREEQFGNGVRTTYIQEADTGRISTATTRQTGQTGPFGLRTIEYRYDARGNVEALIDRSNQQQDLSRSRVFQYDSLDRLQDSWTARVEESTYVADQPLEHFEYTATGNIHLQTGVGEYTYDPARPAAVQYAGENEFRYDDLGRQWSRTGPDVAGGKQIITYTSFDLPSRIDIGMESPAPHVDFEYNGEQERVLKTTADEERIYAGKGFERVHAAADPATARHNIYRIYAGRTLVALVVQAEFDGSSVGEPSIEYQHTDHLGSRSLATAANGTAAALQEYSVFGRPSASAPATDHHGFTGHEHDDELGLLNMNGRIYDPRIGRVLTPDPIMGELTDSQRLNTYSYVNNNPLNVVDPTGFEPWKCDENNPGCKIPQGFHPELDNNGNWVLIPDVTVMNGFNGSISTSYDPKTGQLTTTAGDVTITTNLIPGASGAPASVGGGAWNPAMASAGPGGGGFLGQNWISPTGEPLRFFMGTKIHQDIAAAYAAAHTGELVTSNNITVSVLAGRLQGNAGALGVEGGTMPDLVNHATREIYEIKPVHMAAQGAQDLEAYLQAFTNAGVGLQPGGPSPGTHGVLTYPSGLVVRYGWTAPGLIVYDRTYPSPVGVPALQPDSEGQRSIGRNDVLVGGAVVLTAVGVGFAIYATGGMAWPALVVAF